MGLDQDLCAGLSYGDIRKYVLSLVAQTVKRLPTIRETQVWSLGREDPLEKEMATHPSILAWKIPWTEVPGRLQSMGSQRGRHDWATSLSLFSLSLDSKSSLAPATCSVFQRGLVTAQNINSHCSRLMNLDLSFYPLPFSWAPVSSSWLQDVSTWVFHCQLQLKAPKGKLTIFPLKL